MNFPFILEILAIDGQILSENSINIEFRLANDKSS